MHSIINTIKPTSMQPPPSPGSQSTADIPQGPDLSDPGAQCGPLVKFGTNSLQGFPTLTFSFLSVVHPLNVYEVIAHNIYVHWISAPFKYLRVSRKINKNDQENGYSCTENISIFFSKTPGVWDPASARTLGCTARSPLACALKMYFSFSKSSTTFFCPLKFSHLQRQ